jgi:hypothetical protein
MLLWGAALALALAAWTRVRHAVPAAGAMVPDAEAPAPAPVARVPAGVLAAAGEAARRGDPFRLDRAPAPVRFGAPPAPAPGMAPPPPPRAPLTLAGVVGPPWQALIEGMPGHAGAVVVRAGDRVEDLRILSVTREQAVVRGTDTTWRLTLKRPVQ